MQCHDLREAAVAVGLSDTVASVGAVDVVQGKVSGPDFVMDQWIALGSVSTAEVITGKVIAVPNGYTHVRVYTTSFTSGAVIAALSGKGSRTF